MKKDKTQEILDTLLEIPKGKVMTYKTLADKCGVHPRKVAMTMKYNKHPGTYPCYKVISHSGDVGWYSAADGQMTKIEKLKADGIPIRLMKVPREYII